MNRKDIKRKYLKYVDDCIGHGDGNHANYQEWLEQTVIDLANENSLLCPIADFDVITSLKTEKLFMMEWHRELEDENKRLKELLKKLYNTAHKLDFAYCTLAYRGESGLTGEEYEKLTDVTIEVEEYLGIE